MVHGLEYTMRPIGVIHSSFTDQAETPIQPSRSQAIGQVELYPDFAAGLQDIYPRRPNPIGLSVVRLMGRVGTLEVIS